MQLAYIILYVENVRTSVAFYRDAFGLREGFVHPSGDYAQMDTGQTALAFSSRRLMTELGKNPALPDSASPSSEVAFTTSDVAGALNRAIDAGATLIQDAQDMPWGQTVGYVADLDGFLVEICTPVSAQP